ncbi:MAG TPA: NAD-dependent epimerase/dehydratase family protein [Ferruginibacter sp.]|nr:NAD-dependent epimerase/dehydratase family protein [Ferruginibacter sp.]
MKLALTGASGHVGAALLHETQRRNIPVKALVRDTGVAWMKNLPVTLVPGDLFSKQALDELVSGCDVLIHGAAYISVNGDPRGLVHQTNVDGTRAVVEAAIRGGVKRFIYISSIHAFKQEPSGELLDETRAPVDDSAFAYDRSKYAGQQIALEANNHGMETIVVNPTSIIGPYDFKPSLLGQVIIDLYRGKLPFVFDGGFNFCDCRDIAGGILNACTLGRPGELYLLGGKWYSLKQLVGYLSAASGKNIRVAALPEWVAKAGLPFVELWGKIRRQEPQYTIEAIEALFRGNRCISSEKAMRELNYQHRPLEETIRDTVEWFANKGYLVR